ncbi:MAG TPA: YraN family protein [Longimicrobiales bacterium]|nr:YraN family protein [Longimicrobiales bacterium]
MDTHLRGRAFEHLAADHLRRLGYRIVARNVRAGREEIDLVVRNGDVVAFVEVKGRTCVHHGHPLMAIDRRKRARIARVAREWIGRHGRPGDTYRFDAVAVTRGPQGWRTHHVADAWRLG